jgi:hypothetical protein
MFNVGIVNTMIVAVSLPLPPAPVTEIVYVISVVGETVLDPVKFTAPIPWLIAALLASEEVQSRDAD